MTYDFPGAQNTYFFALGNNGNAAGHYEDSEGLYRTISELFLKLHVTLPATGPIPKINPLTKTLHSKS